MEFCFKTCDIDSDLSHFAQIVIVKMNQIKLTFYNQPVMRIINYINTKMLGITEINRMS